MTSGRGPRDRSRGSGGAPLYLQIERELRARIDEQELAPGAALPSEEQICEQYGVSRITVRRALDGLIAQGLIVRRHGVGSFVARRDAGMRSHLTGSLQEFLTSAATLRTRVEKLGRASVSTPAEVRDIFRLGARQEAWLLEAVASLDGEGPVAYLKIWFPPEIGERLRPDELEGLAPVVSMVERRCGLRVVRAEQLVEADHAGREAARHLGLDETAPILSVRRVYYAAEDRPVEIAYARYHPQRYRYAIEYRSG